MAFENLTDRLSNVFSNLGRKGKLSEDDVNQALREVRMALLEADVNFKLVKEFIAKVKEKAIGEEVLNSLTPAQTVVKIVNDELTEMMGSETTEITLRPASEISVIMMVGLQGAGKTTTAAKLAGKFKSAGRTPVLVACDIYRPAAIDQLRVNAEKVKVPFFSLGDKISLYGQSGAHYGFGIQSSLLQIYSSSLHVLLTLFNLTLLRHEAVLVLKKLAHNKGRRINVNNI